VLFLWVPQPSTFAQNLPPYLPADGLLGWWPFNGNANDESGNGNHGTIHGPVLAPDRFGEDSRCFEFQGGYVGIPFDEQLASLAARTVSVWFHPTSLQFGGRLYEATNETIGAGCYGNNQFDCWMQFEEKAYNAVGLSYGTDNAWHHLVYIANPEVGMVTVYLDGGLVFSESPTDNPNQNNSWEGHTLKIGQGISNESFVGFIDDFGIWDRALSNDEVMALCYGATLVPGCTDESACNFNQEANSDDGT
jgi:hypothetical protein